MSEQGFVATTPGLEAALRDELTALGFHATLAAGGCDVEGPEGTIVRVNVRSRLASRVWWKLGTAATVGELAKVPLRQALGALPLALSIEKTAGAPSSPPAEAWRAAASKVWRLGSDGVEAQLRVGDRGGAVFVETSGELLHFRGWRQEVGKAPLRETLASGVLRLARWRPGEPLWDVMCGSGTIVIEAAEQARGLQPGRSRKFTFERFVSFDERALEAAKAVGPATTTWLRGSDLNAGALGVARRNARRAGVLDGLMLERLDATALTRPTEPPGLIVANLPYGKRVGTKFELHGLFSGLGASLKKALGGWRFAFLLQEGEASLGLPIDERHAVSNGGLRCSVVVGRVP